ncbi:MAG: carboxypeptidase regulatory-like domain-containing protein, partial [Candidatus Omnitrophica bacterium]|nr:carboxypeptidase regulatory-like domain-containing protein [Candidatus Omnitrophota bacterium]
MGERKISLKPILAFFLFSAPFIFQGPCFAEGTSGFTDYFTFTQVTAEGPTEPSRHSTLGGSLGLGSWASDLGMSEIGIRGALDTFWAMSSGGNQRTDIKMKVHWNFDKNILNEINEDIGAYGSYVTNTFGMFKISTEEFHFVRQFGFSTKIGLDVNINGTWHNNLVGVTIADLGINIDDRDNEKIGPKTGSGTDPDIPLNERDSYFHSDTVNVSDIPELVNGFATKIVKILEKLGSSALSGYGATVSKTALEKFFEKALNFSLGVHATYRTYSRWLEFDVDILAKDFDGNIIPLALLDSTKHMVINDESGDYYLYINMSRNDLALKKPIKEINVTLSNAKYHYKLQDNVEVGIRSSVLSLTSGALSRPLFVPKEYVLNAPKTIQFKVVADPLYYYPCHGQILSGDPPSALRGIKVVTEYPLENGRIVSREWVTDTSGKFYNDAWVSSPLKPAGWRMRLYWGERYVRAFGPRSPELQRGPNDEITIKIDLPVDETASISGTVKDSFGNPLPDVDVCLNGPDRWTKTDTQGRYIFDNVPKADVYTVYAQKKGLNFSPVSKTTTASGHHALTIDIIASAGQLIGDAKINFKLPSSASSSARLPQRVEIEFPGLSGSAASFLRSGTYPLDAQGSILIPLIDTYNLNIRLKHDNYRFEPENLTVNFTPSEINTVKNFEVRAIPLFSQGCTLSLDKNTIDVAGWTYLNATQELRPKEKAIAQVQVTDVYGRPMSGIKVFFSAVSRSGNVKIKFLGADHFDYGIATTDANGIAKMELVSANYNPGIAEITANTLEDIHANQANYRNYSRPVTLYISSPNSRLVELEPPTATLTLVPKTKVISA